MNIVLAFVFFFIVLFFGGASMSNTIGDVIDAHPAHVAGIVKNDKIVSIDGKKISSWPEMQLLIRDGDTDQIQITIERDTQRLTFSLTPLFLDAVDKDGNPTTVRVIGVLPFTIEGDFWGSMNEAGINVIVLSKYILISLYNLITGKLSTKAISGPVAIMLISSDVAKQGVLALVNFMALLSLSLAIFNLLPIPALDGSHLFFILYEFIVRRPVSFKLQERVAQIGFAALMLLMVLVSYNDIFNNISKFKKLIPFIQ
jgi:regulator of sigma E protease